MIVNLKKRSSFNFLVILKQLLNVVIFKWQMYRDGIKISHDRKNLKQYFLFKYPGFKFDHVGNSLCISCGLCIEVCPVDAIEIKKPNLVNFPSSLKTGEAPKNFFLDTSFCTKCNLCAIACPVEALELNQEYGQLKKVDLVRMAETKKAGHGTN
ncbi:MAG: hypothetical protein CME62_01760 [Halobacteriovoraceae bacterium]|nr:hypothetical protein [Halobacteriovoraceae bacterium]